MENIEKQSYRLGIDLGGTNIKAGVVNAKNMIISTYSMPTGAHRASQEIISDIAKAAQNALKQANLTLDECLGIGVGIPGTVDVKNGTTIYFNNFNDFDNVPIQNELEKLLRKPVKINNDASCAALGEFVAGAAKGYNSAILITLGTGVGTAFIFDGNIFNCGGNGNPEGGHIIIEQDGELCTCGNKGCLEAYASATALIRDAKKAAEENPNSLLAKMYSENSKEMNGIIPFAASKAGDDVGKAVIDNYVKHLGVGIVSFVNILRPQVVLISGGVSNQKKYLTDKLNSFVKTHVFAGDKIMTAEIKTATLGSDAGIVGAAALWS